MRISASIFLIALGAILTFAVHVHTNGFSLHTGGIILMIIGGGALILTLVLMNRRPRTAVDGRTVQQQPVYVEPVRPQAGYVEPRQQPVYVEPRQQAGYDEPRLP